LQPLRRLLASASFGQALVFTTLFSAAFAFVIVALFFSTVRLLENQTAETVAAELRGLSDRYRDEGLNGLLTNVAQRSGRNGDPDAVYLVARPNGTPIAGNLTSWPPDAVPDGSWTRLRLARADGLPHVVGTRSFRLAGGYLLLVGRDFSARQNFRDNLLVIYGVAVAVVVALGLIGGLLMSRNLLRRVDAITEASRRIMAGDLGERVPTDGSNDEFDRLAGNLNRMLARIEELMLGMSAVSVSISHDLRSPLSRLRNRAEMALVEAHPGDDAILRQALEETVADTDSVLATFNALTEIAQAEAGTARTTLEPIDLAALVRDAGELYGPVAEDKGVDFVIDAADPSEIRGHIQLLSQALGNLFDNAIKYTPGGGRIAVTVRALEDGGVALSVADSGPGIPAADRKRVLERFVRLDASRTEPGSGLGLSLVAAVVRLHDGRLTLEDADCETEQPGLRIVWWFPPA
jgi:signal transduction histidine kinase